MTREETLRLALQGRGAELAREVATDFDSGHWAGTWDKLVEAQKMLQLLQSLKRSA